MSGGRNEFIMKKKSWQHEKRITFFKRVLNINIKDTAAADENQCIKARK